MDLCKKCGFEKYGVLCQHSDENKKMSLLMATAGAWYNGQTSALYSLYSTEKVHTEEHRKNLVSEIETELDGLNKNQGDYTTAFNRDEYAALLHLRTFVQQFKVQTTLAQWSKQTGILPTHPTTERQAVSVVIEPSELNPLYNKLWDLSDYVVSSVSGIVVWLTPRK